MVSYDRFIRDLSSCIVRMMKTYPNDPEFVCQREAYRLFGRRNVERWRRQGRLPFYKRPGKVEFRTADLRLLQQTEQDYFTDLPSIKELDNKRKSDSKGPDL